MNLFAPDMVSGSEQEHLPVAASTLWLWGVLGTMAHPCGMGRDQEVTDVRETWAASPLRRS